MRLLFQWLRQWWIEFLYGDHAEDWDDLTPEERAWVRWWTKN